MADETIIAGNPAVLRMKFERDGCKVTATALDIGEMPNAYYHGEYTIQKCDTIGNVVLTHRILSISPDGVVDHYMDARTKIYAHPELAHEAMASFAAAVDEMGRVHAPKAAQTAEPQPECPSPYAETDGDFALRMWRLMVDRIEISRTGEHRIVLQEGGSPCKADLLRLATLIGGAA